MPKNAIDVAIGGNADMTFCGANVRLRPKADIACVVALCVMAVSQVRSQVGFLVLTKRPQPKQVERGPSAQGNPP
jgi:hypothetical protein